jgi:hypothetical protein
MTTTTMPTDRPVRRVRPSAGSLVRRADGRDMAAPRFVAHSTPLVVERYRWRPVHPQPTASIDASPS